MDVDQYHEVVRLAWSEDRFMREIIDLAHEHGWRVVHFRPLRTKYGWRTPVQGDGSGWPDLVLCHSGRGELVFLEVKSEKGRASPQQAEWLGRLSACGVIAEVVRPRDWNWIGRMLKGE